MVELKCRAELAVTGRSACRNASCENAKERGGRIPQGKLRWGIGGPGGHSMKWYCIRPRCLPADQVKDMLVPEKCGSAPEMDGVPELPDGFREATITCLEFINEDKADQLDASVLAKLDEVGPMLPVLPRAPVRGDAAPTPPTIGRQGLRRARRSTTAAAAAAAGGGASSGVGGGAVGGGGEDEDPDSGDNQPTMSRGGGGKGGGGGSSSSFTNLPARTPPALLIPRRTDSGHGGDSPVLPPPEKLPKLDDDASSEDVGAGAGAGAGVGVGVGVGVGAGAGAGAASSLSGDHHDMYHSAPPDDVGLFEAGGALGSLDDAAGAAGGGQGAGDSSLLFEGLDSGFGQRVPGSDDPAGGSGSHATGFTSPAEGIRDTSAAAAAAAASPGYLREPSAAAAGGGGLEPSTLGAGVEAPPAEAAGAAARAAAGGAGAGGTASLELSGLGGFSSFGAASASAPLPVDEARTSGEIKPSAGSGLESTLASSADVVASSLLGGNDGEADDPVASALQGIIGDEVDLIDDPSAPISDPYGSGGASAGAAPAPAPAATQESSAPTASSALATGANILGAASSALPVPPGAAPSAPAAPAAPPAPAVPATPSVPTVPASLTPPTAAASAASTGGDVLGSASASSEPAPAPSPSHAAPSTEGGGSSTSDPPLT